MDFKRIGKTYQAVFKNGKDLDEVLTLDEPLWAATSAPSNLFKADPTLIAALDPGKTGRISSNALKDAIRWTLQQLIIVDPKLPKEEYENQRNAKLAALVPEFDGVLKFAEINTLANPVGDALIKSGQYILSDLGESKNDSITLAQIRKFLDTVAKRPLNGDGVLTPISAGPNDKLKGLIIDAIAATGGTQDVSTEQGVTEKNLTDFLAAAKDFLAWKKQGEIPAGETKTAIMTFGTDTPALSALSQKFAAQVDEFFKLSGLLAFDQRLNAQILGPENKAAAFDAANQEQVDAYLNGLPFSTPVASGILSLNPDGINPLYRDWWIEMTAKVIKPVLGDDVAGITKQDWAKVRGVFSAYEGYMAGKKGAIVEKIAADKLQGYLADEAALLTAAKDLMVADKGVADTTAAAREVEKLLLMRTNIFRIVNNFISFAELYDPKHPAIFECGELVIDGRRFTVSFNVEDVAAHMAVAKSSMLCLLYVDVNISATEKKNVVVPVTAGSKGNLHVGKRGVFFDLNKKEYDAVVVQMIENPICIQEALSAPFNRLWNIVESTIENWTNAAEKKLQGDFTKAITAPATGAPAPAPAPAAGAAPAKSDKSGMIMGVSVAIAAIGSSFAFISKTISSMSWLQICGTVLAAILGLMGLLFLLSYLKLRKQDLSTVLEGCGWGINLRMRFNHKLRCQLTNFGFYPEGATGTPRKTFFKWLLLLLCIAAIAFGGYKYYQHVKSEKCDKAQTEQQVEDVKAAAEDAAKSAEDAAKSAEDAAKSATNAAAPAPAAEAK